MAQELIPGPDNAFVVRLRVPVRRLGQAGVSRVGKPITSGGAEPLDEQEYEWTVQTSKTLLEVAMIWLLIARQGRRN